MRLIHEESFGVVPLEKKQQSWQVCLILHKQGNHWGFPKGKRDPGEEPQTAAIRELKEETGLNILRFLREKPIVETYQFRKKGKLISKTVHYFPALVEGNLQLQWEEVREAKWVPLEKATEALTFKEAQLVCYQVMEMLANDELDKV